MQVDVEEICMYTKFSGHGISFSNLTKFPFQTSPLRSKVESADWLMSHACTPILVGVVSLVSEIPLHSKTAKFPFLTMDYIVHGSEKV